MVGPMSLRTAEAVGRGQSPTPPEKKRRRPPVPILMVAAVVLAVVVLAVLTRSGGTDKNKVAANKTTSSTAAGAASDGLPQAPSIAGADGTGGAGTKGAAGPDDSAARAARAMEEQAKAIPLNVAVSSTKGLKDGDPVTIHVTPKPGAIVFGFEAFLCKGGTTTYAFDADIRPDDTGKCVAHKLSPNSDDYLQVKAQPPYSSADATFRVGVGTDMFQMTDGSPASVTCGANNPCAIVLKLQYPNGFGFEAFPVTYR
jgi:hypothetical protein